MDNSCTPEEYRTLYERFRRIAIRVWQTPEQTEDIAQNAVLRALKNPNWRQIYLGKNRIGRASSFAVIDGIREVTQDEYTRKGGRVPTYDVFTYPTLKNHPNLTKDAEEHQDQFQEIIDRLPKNWQKHRIVLYLTYVWGLQDTEIALAFGVTHSRISQLRTEALNFLKTRRLKPEDR